MLDFFHGIEDLFVNVLFAPFDWLRALELESWWAANMVSWVFIIIGFVLFTYWMLELKKYDKHGDAYESRAARPYRQ